MTWTVFLKDALGSFFGALGFLWLVHAPRRSWIPAGLIAGLTYLLYRGLCALDISDPLSVFCGVLTGSLAAHLCARKMKIINTVFLMAAIVPVVPGLGLYRMMAYLGQRQTVLGAEQGIQAMITIAMTALGLVMASFLDRIFHPRKNPPRD